MSIWHDTSIEETRQKLETDIHRGLSEEEAQKRLLKFGENVLKEKKKKNLFVKFLEQFKDFMILILILAAILSVISTKGEDWIDAVIILLIVVVNAVIGIVQENKAEKSMEALQKMSAPRAKVIRDGRLEAVEASKLVPGDLIQLEAGDLVPADARLVESANLKAEESALTGESVPVDKDAQAVVDLDATLGDRINMVISSSVITYGRGKAIVTGTGMDTEVGVIAGMIMESEDERTPLQKKLNDIGKLLGIAALVICAVMFVVGIINGKAWLEMLMTSVSLAVAAIPEGLPAIVTIVLAFGVQRMVKKHAIIRKLSAVETLGGASVICSDKTGTLTQNKMTVMETWSASGGEKKEILRMMTLCNDSVVEQTQEGLVEKGDPTETALVMASFKEGDYKAELEKQYPRVEEIPFDSDRKMMTTVHKMENGYRIITKGAPDVLLGRCTGIAGGKSREEIDSANEAMASKALRVLAVAYRDVEEIPQDMTSEAVEKDLTFVGMVGMIDPPREEVKEAVALCAKAGIRPVMITGDHIITAVAIARELGIYRDTDEAVTGKELEKISDEELSENVERYSVYARVSPEHKVRIVKAWQKSGKVVAMTGDGVNDAPALKAANIGCAMGITGTDVSKGAADMILTDDNFATIVAAVEQGRGIFANIKKSIHFLLSCNIGEIVTLFLAVMLNLRQMPLVAVQLLWVNLVTDSLPALALGVEPVEKGVMDEKPRDPKKSIFSGGLAVTIGWQGAMIGLLTLTAYVIGEYIMGGDAAANAMSFGVLAYSQLVHAFNVRSGQSLFQVGLFSNKAMLKAFGVSALLQTVVLAIPALAKIFNVHEIMNVQEWLIVIGLSLVPIVVCEIVKAVKSGLKRTRRA